MITRLRLENFKSFKEAELTLGPLTLLVGTNASGKSNLRDAFRFLHGIGRGYSLADIFGEKYESGERVWSGIRGGPREIAFHESSCFTLEASFPFTSRSEATYRIEIEVGDTKKPSSVISESLIAQGYGEFVYRAFSERKDTQALQVQISEDGTIRDLTFSNQRPVLSEIRPALLCVPDALQALGSIQFLDFDPEAMRRPSIPGQAYLGDKGENLSSTLLAICENRKLKRALIQWIQTLTPMDAINLDFPADFSGKVLVHLIEQDGQRISANSASDGTLRFLGMLAAFFQPYPIGLFFLDEIETGIHPTRLHLLLQLIEQQASQQKNQVVATTHSPQLLQLLSPEMREYVHLTYRLEDHPETRIKRLLDIPDAQRVIEKYGFARLQETNWLENAVAFDEGSGDAA